MFFPLTVGSITTYNSRVLIIDAGHIAIESELAERKTIQNILLKRQQDRSGEESQRLVDESYDKFSLRLEAAQACTVLLTKLSALKRHIVHSWSRPPIIS